MKTARVYLPKKKLCESSGSYVKPAKNLFRSPATNSTNPNFLMIGDGSVLLFCNIHSQNRFADKSNDERR